MGMLDHSSAWNKHQGVGATLLDNYVEERAVGDKIIKERSDIIFLSKNGHSDLISQKHLSDSKSAMITTAMEAFGNRANAPRKIPKGKRKLYLERQMAEQASNVPKAPEEPTEYITIASSIGGNYEPNPLGHAMPDSRKVELFNKPITFWSTTSIRPSHGKDTRFSTPIELSLHDQ